MWFIRELDGELSKESKELHIITLLQIWYCVNLNNSTNFPLGLWLPQAWFSLCAAGLKSRGQLVTSINRHATISQVGTFCPADWFCRSQALQLGKAIVAFAPAAAGIPFSSHLKVSCRGEDFPSVPACLLYIFDVWWGRGDGGTACGRSRPRQQSESTSRLGNVRVFDFLGSNCPNHLFGINRSLSILLRLLVSSMSLSWMICSGKETTGVNSYSFISKVANFVKVMIVA